VAPAPSPRPGPKPIDDEPVAHAPAERARLPIGRATMPPAPQIETARVFDRDKWLDAARRVMDLFMSRFDLRDLPQTYPPELEWRDRIYNELSRCIE